MDRLAELSSELSSLLEQLQSEANGSNMRELMAPIAWLDEANSWLRYELRRVHGNDARDPVPFTYVPLALRGRQDIQQTAS
jgi:hypothetical protein